LHGHRAEFDELLFHQLVPISMAVR
jgi:hypothetical protein